MAKKRKNKKIGFLAAFTLSVVALVSGCLVGFCAKTFVLAETYEIPTTEKFTQSSAQSGINVETVKQKDLSIHFLQLGNKYTGDCTFIKAGEVEILIDAGSRADSVQSIYDYVNPYIDGDLDYVIVTHAHQDHYAGFATSANVDSLFDKIKVNTVVKFAKTNQKDTSKLYSNFKRELEETKTKNGTVVYDVKQCFNELDGAKRTYALGDGLELEFLYQKFYDKKASTENDYSVCCMINQTVDGGEYHYLFTGDLEKEGELSLVEENDLPQVKLYKAGHHGSKTSSSNELLQVVRPETVCVCACAGSSEYTVKNENQFPTQAFIDRVSEHTRDVFVTSLCIDYEKGQFAPMNGDIVYTATLSGEAKLFFSHDTTPLYQSDWFKTNRTMPPKWKT